MSLVYSNGKLDVSNRSYPISVRFASPDEIEIPIKQINRARTLPEISGRTKARVTPLTGLRLNSNKMEMTMMITMPTKTKVGTKKRSIRSNRQAQADPDQSFNSHRQIEFHLQAPKAGSVKLAADFTDWEKSPLEMTRDAAGMWFASVSLLPGEYAYRFIVDGEWSDDPLSFHNLPNPYGSVNSVKRVG
jgi:hypothetical protein